MGSRFPVFLDPPGSPFRPTRQSLLVRKPNTDRAVSNESRFPGPVDRDRLLPSRGKQKKDSADVSKTSPQRTVSGELPRIAGAPRTALPSLHSGDSSSKHLSSDFVIHDDEDEVCVQSSAEKLPGSLAKETGPVAYAERKSSGRQERAAATRSSSHVHGRLSPTRMSKAKPVAIHQQPSFAKQPSFLKHQASFKVSEIVEADFVDKVSGLEQGTVPTMPNLFDKLDDMLAFRPKDWAPTPHDPNSVSEQRRVLGMSGQHTPLGTQNVEIDTSARVAFQEGDIVEVVKDCLSFCEREAAEMAAMDRRTHKDKLFFTSELHESFEPFGIESGPIDIGKMVQFCKMIRLKRAENPGRHLVYTCMDDAAHCTLACLLLASYLVLELGYDAPSACEPFVKGGACPLVTFLDASNRAGGSAISISDCVQALSKAVKAGWFEVDSFDVLEYEALGHPHGLDMQRVCPKFVALRQPSAPGMQRRIAKGVFTKCPDDFVQALRRYGVTEVVRLVDNEGSTEEQYTPWQFARHGFGFHELPCPATRMPTGEVIRGFFRIMDKEGAVAVHCSSGLASTGTMLGLYLMKQLAFTADEAVAWARLVRPGSVLGPQHEYLRSCQHRVWKGGEMQGYQLDGVRTYPRASAKEMERLTSSLLERQWKRARQARMLDGDRSMVLVDLGVELGSPLLSQQSDTGW